MEILKICSPCLKLILGTASAVLRVLVISFALFILLYVSSRIPAALQLLLKFFLQLFDFVASPAFAFCVCNAIIAAIIAAASRSATRDDVVDESYNEMIEIADDLRDHWTLSLLLSDTYYEEELCEKVVLHGDEKITSQLMDVVTFCKEKESESNKASSVPDSDENCDNDEDEGMMVHETVRMRNDELKRRVEDFITRELRFRREETLAHYSSELLMTNRKSTTMSATLAESFKFREQNV